MIPQFVPYWGRAETEAVAAILEGNGYLNEHHMVRRFEKSFAEMVGARYCAAVTSGTAALYCSIKAAGMAGTVTVPSHDGIFAYNALRAAGCTPLVRDVDGSGLLGACEGPRIVVHANGRISCMVDTIEDCAQAITHHTRGAVSVYSFASTKHITTAGQGGAVCCDDPEMFGRLVRLKDHGRNDRQSLRPMSDTYDEWGMNFKMTEIQAAFGLAQLDGLAGRLDRFRRICRIYRESLGDAVHFDSEPGWYADMFTPHAASVHETLRERGVACRPYPRPLHMQRVAESHASGAYPNAERRYHTGLYLPSTTNMSDDDARRIASEVLDALP